MKKLLCYGVKLTLLLLLFSIPAFSQAGGTPTSGAPNVPIDGGASLLAAAGVAYGVKKYRDYRKNSPDQEDDI